MSVEPSNPTLKGRLLNLQKQAKRMKDMLMETDAEIKSIHEQIHGGTEATIISDKIHFISDLLNEKLEQIEFRIRKHIAEQKQKSNQLVELIGLIKNEKVRLQGSLLQLQERIEVVRAKIGDSEENI